MRAQTKPSPPLLPGPATTQIAGAPRGLIATTASATARPAFSISRMPGVPACDRQAVGLRHFGSGEQFDHDAGDSIGGDRHGQTDALDHMHAQAA